jgi:hypothetical protein
MNGEPVTTPSGIRVSLLRISEVNGLKVKPQWDDELEELIFDAEFHSDYRLRIRVSISVKARHCRIKIK